MRNGMLSLTFIDGNINLMYQRKHQDARWILIFCNVLDPVCGTIRVLAQMRGSICQASGMLSRRPRHRSCNDGLGEIFK